MNIDAAWDIVLKKTGGDDLLKACYYDYQTERAIERFNASEEWAELRRIMFGGGKQVERIVDIGAGNGVVSANMVAEGLEVIAIEPCGSDQFGYGAIRRWACGVCDNLKVVSASGESMPLKDNCTDCVYMRQVLHHISRPDVFMDEIYRILKPKGLLIIAREHVVDSEADKEKFLENHPLHKYTKSENAFTLQQYKNIIESSNLNIKKVYGSWDTPINYYPATKSDIHSRIRNSIRNKIGRMAANALESDRIYEYAAKWYSRRDRTAGRMNSFICVKPERKRWL